MNTAFPKIERLVLAAFTAAALAGCSATNEAARDTDPNRSTMTMAEMRLNEAGGPSKPEKPAGLASVQSPADTTPSSRALTDAGPNTPLGKEWIFTSITNFGATLPGPPKVASFVMSRGNGRLVGSTSCNPLTAAFTIDIPQGTLSFQNIVNGNAMCDRASGDVEDAVVDAMIATDGFLLAGNKLSLLSKGATIAELTTP